MLFATPNTGTKWRVDTILEKEPCTLEWIAGFGGADILVDIGANVGMYTIWSAATKGVRVYAFEPEAQNYALLNRNIVLNNLQERVKAFCLGLSDKAGLTELYMAQVIAGGSCHAMGAATMPLLPNSLFTFVKGDNSFHGVEPVRDANTRRWLLLFDVFMEQVETQRPQQGGWRATVQLAPAPAAAPAGAPGAAPPQPQGPKFTF
jgi:hypothetical protein